MAYFRARFFRFARSIGFFRANGGAQVLDRSAPPLILCTFHLCIGLINKAVNAGVFRFTIKERAFCSFCCVFRFCVDLYFYGIFNIFGVIGLNGATALFRRSGSHLNCFVDSFIGHAGRGTGNRLEPQFPLNRSKLRHQLFFKRVNFRGRLDLRLGCIFRSGRGGLSGVFRGIVFCSGCINAYILRCFDSQIFCSCRHRGNSPGASHGSRQLFERLFTSHIHNSVAQFRRIFCVGIRRSCIRCCLLLGCRLFHRSRVGLLGHLRHRIGHIRYAVQGCIFRLSSAGDCLFNCHRFLDTRQLCSQFDVRALLFGILAITRSRVIHDDTLLILIAFRVRVGIIRLSHVRRRFV